MKVCTINHSKLACSFLRLKHPARWSHQTKWICPQHFGPGFLSTALFVFCSRSPHAVRSEPHVVRAETDEKVTERSLKDLVQNCREQPDLISELGQQIPDQCHRLLNLKTLIIFIHLGQRATMIHENGRITESLARQVMELRRRIHEFETSRDVMVLKGGKKNLQAPRTCGKPASASGAM